MDERNKQSSVVAAVIEQAKELCMPRLGALTKLNGQERLPKGGATCADCWKMIRNWPGKESRRDSRTDGGKETRWHVIWAIQGTGPGMGRGLEGHAEFALYYEAREDFEARRGHSSDLCFRKIIT